MPELAELRDLYERRAAQAAKQAESHDKKGRLVGNLRGVSFATFVIAGGYGLAEAHWGAGVLGALGAAAFGGLIAYHDRVLEAEQSARRSELVNRNSSARVNGTWRSLPDDGSLVTPPDHGYAEDLDLFGPGSVYQRISVAHTRYGQARLASWLAHPATPAEISRRQEAVIELAPQLEFRQSFEAEALALIQKRRGDQTLSARAPDPKRLLEWVGDRSGLAGGLFTVILSYAIPLATSIGIVLQLRAGFPPYAWLVPLLLGLALLTATKNATSSTFAAVSTTEGAFLRYGALLEKLERLEVVSPWLAERKKRLETGAEGEPPSAVMRRFRRLVGWFDMRHNGMVYPFINALLLWDIHCTAALYRWRRSAGTGLEGWFEVIGEFEAISSLSGLRHDEPHSCMPTIDVSRDRSQMKLAGTAVGHPLLRTDERVTNAVEAFGPGQGLLVTGSNMSGKSTFLRSLGVNLVLGLAGAPVCASAMQIPYCRLGSSIRISDSLASGVSHFYREVQKLAWVVEHSGDDVAMFFLLDEILHGTNSRERQIGARWVIGELLSRGAFGVVTTHDMELCQLPGPLMKRVRQHHFRESVQGDEMTFDYRLREGPVQSGNALRLMRLVGLDVPLEPDQDAPPG